MLGTLPESLVQISPPLIVKNTDLLNDPLAVAQTRYREQIDSFKNQIMENDLILPHPRMHTRNFVLLPLFEIDKDWEHPVLKININERIFIFL